MEATVERYVIKKGMHLGPLRREIRVDSIIEWEPLTETLKIDGHRIDRGRGIEPGEAMRQLRLLSERNPNDAPMELLELTSEQVDSTKHLSTSSLCVLPILGCLTAAEVYLENKLAIPPELTPVTDQQGTFLEMFEDLMHDVQSVPELESRADQDEKVINAWLRERGFDIQLSPNPDPQGFAVASIFDILLNWLHAGTKTYVVDRNQNDHMGVSMKGGVAVAHMVALHPHPVVRIATKSGDTVCMSMVDDIPDDIAGLFLKIADLERVKATSYNYKGVVFPMVDMNIRNDISWISGLQVGGGYRVAEALQQTKFRMNEVGARAQSAVAMSFSRGITASSDEPHIIDRPFVLWIRREGFEFPLFAALLCEDVWKEPAEL